MNVRNTLIVGVAALLPFAAVASEGYDKSGKPDKASSFASLDANRDGRISQTEAAVDSRLVFSTADVNGDGYLDKAEFNASQKGSANPVPAPQTEPVSPADPSMPRATDTETPQP